MGECLGGTLGEAIVERASEELTSTVQKTGGLELSRTNDPETLAQLRPDDILPAISSGQREVGRLDAHPPREGR